MVENPETVATAIRIGHPQSWDKAWNAQKDSGGWFDECSDLEILDTQKLLAESEGIFCEPASAVSLAGAINAITAGTINDGSKVVCTLTGHGLKDPDTVVVRQGKAQIVTIDATLTAVRKAIVNNTTD